MNLDGYLRSMAGWNIKAFHYLYSYMASQKIQTHEHKLIQEIARVGYYNNIQLLARLQELNFIPETGEDGEAIQQQMDMMGQMGMLGPGQEPPKKDPAQVPEKEIISAHNKEVLENFDREYDRKFSQYKETLIPLENTKPEIKEKIENASNTNETRTNEGGSWYKRLFRKASPTSPEGETSEEGSGTTGGDTV